MGLRSWLASKRRAKVHQYLATHKDLTAVVLRADPELATAAVTQALDLAAAGMSDRKSIPWPVLNQLGAGGRAPTALTLPKVTPFNLRKFSEYPPARRAINALCNPILDQPWAIEPIPDVLGRDEQDTLPKEQETRILAATNMLRHPNPDESWRVMLEQVLEDLVIGGYGAIELVETADAARPFLLFPVDGQSIRLNAKWDGSDPMATRYTQSLGYTGLSVATYDVVELRDDQLIYIKLNPRTNTPFGLGYLEVAFSTVNAFLGAFDFATRRASNATPAYGLFLGENIDIATARQWQMYWQQEIEGQGRIPIIGGGRQPSVFHLAQNSQDQLWIGWQEFLLRVIAMSFGLSPGTLGLERDVNRSTAEQQDASDWDTVAPIANTVQNYLTHKLLHQRLGWPDLRFRWLVKDTDEKRQAEILQIQWDMNAITVDELREFYERPPRADGWGDLTKDQHEARAASEYVPDVEGMGSGPDPEKTTDEV